LPGRARETSELDLLLVRLPRDCGLIEGDMFIGAVCAVAESVAGGVFARASIS